MDHTVTTFFTNNGVPATGLSPTIRIWDIDTNMLVVTDDNMTEIGDGFYKYNYMGYDPLKDYVIRADGGASLPDAERYTVGTSDLSKEELADSIWEEPFADHNTLGTMGAKITTLESLLIILQKYESNRTRIDVSTKTLTVYDDDGITPIQIFNLYDSSGSPSVAQVAERDPTL